MEPQNSLPDHPSREESPRARRILEIDEELDSLRLGRPTLFGVVVRALTWISLLGVCWQQLGPDGSSNLIAFVLFAVVAVWVAHVGPPLLEDFQRERRLGLELDALIAEPTDRLEVSDGGV